MDGDMLELIKLAQQGDNKAIENIIQKNSGLIWSIVKRFLNRGYDAEDLYQIGSIGLLKCIKKYLPTGPQFFPSDMITDQPERQIVSEIIREKALKLLQDEIPHGIAVEVSSMKARQNKYIIDIQATIYCERDSHKGIIIGKQGSMLKKIGANARYEIERLLGSSINLQIWIKVKKDWRDSDFLLKNFGYDQKQI